MTKFNLVDNDGVRVCATKCATCIFRPGNLMDLRPGRVKGMVDDCIRQQSTIPCHDTLDLKKQAICRGFYDAHRHAIQLLQVAERLGFTKEV